MKTPSFTTHHQRGFTLLELLVSITIMAILVALLTSWTSSMRDKANTVKCIGNLRTMATGTLAWVTERNGFLWTGAEVGYSRYRMVDDPLGPPSLVRNYVPKGVWLCPAGYKESEIFGNNYTWNFIWDKSLPEPNINQIQNLTTTPMYWDCYQVSLASMYNVSEPINGGATVPSSLPAKYQVKPHYAKTKHQIVYLDGHVKAP